MEYNIAEIHERVYVYLTEELKDTGLRFTLRKRNIGSRLNQGYWFMGNEHYLAFSFWKGLDWRNKTPNIYFAINRDGASTLEFVSYDNEKKIKFFESVAEAIGMQQRTRARTGDAFEHWVKNYKGNDYMQSLDLFLKKDKRIIDAFIKSEGMEQDFESIPENDFNVNKKKIEKIRKSIKKDKIYEKEFDDIKSITLKELSIDNIAIFNNKQTVLFNKNVTCLIGVNGTGKTSILRALVLAFTGFEQNETRGIDDNSVSTSELRNLLRIVGMNDYGRLFAPDGGYTEISYTIQSLTEKDNDYNNRVNISANYGDPLVVDDSNSDFTNVIDDRYKTLFLAFPQVQGKTSTSLKNNEKKHPHISDAISMLNNQPDNRFDSFANWLRDLNNIANAKIATNIKKSKTQNLVTSNDDILIPAEYHLLNTVFEIISAVTNEKIILHDILESVIPNEIWVKIGGEDTAPILLDLMSQGYNNVFGWVGYFMKRLVDITPEGADFTKTSAIVIIDEIDTYLHPTWQTNILAVLCERFPNVQFVTTTHSPYIVGSIPKDKISIYVCKKEGANAFIEPFTEFTPYGANLERLSEKVFGVESRFVQEVRAQFEELEDLIDVGELKKAKAFIDDNFEEIDQEDPEILLRKRLIRAKEILAQ